MKLFNLFRSRTGGFTAQRSPLATALEPRMMFDGAVAATVAEAATTPTADAPAAQDADSSQDTLAAVPSATADQRQEVVFIVGNVANAQQLVDAIEPGTEVVVLDGNQDGLRQIADYLEGREGIDAIHIISHGAEGQLHLGTVTLDQANLASRAGELAVIGRSLSDDGDILLYGCDVARDGDAFLSQLATLTAADVAASIDATGAALHGGDWVLEAHAGTIETDSLLLSDYQWLLALPTDGTYTFAGAEQNPDGTATTSDGFFTISAVDGTGGNNPITADGYGAYIDGGVSAAGPGFTSSIIITTTGSFYLTSAVIGEYTPPPGGSANNDFEDIVVIGYAGGIEVARTTAVSSIGSYQTAYPIDYTPFNGKLIDKIEVQFTVLGEGGGEANHQNTFNIESLSIAGAALTPAPPPDVGNQPPTLSAVGQNPVFQENASTPADLFHSVLVSAVEGSQNIDRITLSVAGLANGAEEILRIDGSNVALIDGTSVTANLGLEVTVSVSGTTATVILAKTGGITAAQAQTVVDGLGYRNTADISADSTRTVTLIDIRDTGGTADGGVDSTVLSIVSTVNLQHDDGSSTEGELVDVLQNHTLSNFANGFTLATSGPLGSANDPLGIYLDNGTSGWFEVSADDIDIGTFDLTAIKLAKYAAPGAFSITVTGIKSDGSADVTTSFTSADGSTSFTSGDFSTFTGLSKFRIDITADGPTDQNVNLITFDSFHVSGVIAPQDAPIVGNLDGASVNYLEGSAAVLLDVGSDATVTDTDSSDFSGGNVTVSIVTNRASGEDVLAIRNQGAGAEQIGVSGSNVTYGGTVIGSFSGGTGSNDLVVSLNASSTPAAVQALVRNLTYSNSNISDPSSASRTVHITVNDGDGGISAASAVTVSITPVNDAPVLTATGSTPTYTENGAAVDLFSDVIISTVEDGQSITGLSLTVANLADGASEILTIDGTDIALTNDTSGTTTGGSAVGYSVTVVGGTATVMLTSAGLSTANAQTLVDGITYRNSSEAPDTGSRVVTLTSITDSGGTANGGGDTSTLAIAATVAINAVNDAPTLSGGPYSLTGTDEDSSSSGTLVSTILAGLTHADVDGPASGIAITASSGNGTWQYSIDGNTWSGIGSVSGSAALLLSSSTQLRYVPDGANGETATLSFRAWDQTSGTASTSMTRSTADTTSNGGSSAFSSGTASASLVVAAVNDAPVLTPVAPILDGLSDSDTDNQGQTVASIVGTSISDVDMGAIEGIAITGLDSGNGTWQYSLDGSDWSDIGSVSSGGALLLRATDHVRFVPDGVNATTASFTYRAWDQSGASAGQQGSKVDATVSGGSSAFSATSDTASITVTAINDAPILTTSGGTTAFVEGDNVVSTPVAIDAGLTLSDPDNATLASATVVITNNFQPGEDVLIFANDGSTMGNISASYNAGSGVLTLTSAGATATLAQWQAALRTVAYTNGSDTPNEATRTISFVVNDGQDSSTAATKAIGVTSVNDTPQVSVPATIDVTEDVASAITGISFSDADAGSGSVTVILAVDSGSLSATSGGGVIVGGVSSSLTLTGSIADINAFIASSNVSFVTSLNATANVTLIASINDGGNTGSGGAKSDSDTTTLQVAAVNDAPVISAPATIAVDEDVTTALTGISFSDVDAGTSPVTVTFSVPSGTLVATGGDGVTVGGTSGSMTLTGSIADINAYIAAGNVTFTTAANSTSDVTLSMAINDGGNTGSGGAQTDATTVTLAVTAVNDAPVNSVPAAQAIDQDAVLVFNDANGNLISISDVDAGSNTVEVTLTASNGLMTLGSIAGLSFSTGDGSAGATMTFSGSIADINNALNGLVFSPTGGYNGPASIQIETNDQGWSGSGGAQSDVDTIAITASPLNPEVVSVQAVSPDGGYKVGDTVTVTVTFDQVVSVDTSGGVPTLLLETGSIDRNAIYVSGSGSNTLTFSYVVQAGDVAADLDYQSTAALALNGATIRSAGNNDAILVLPVLGGADSLAGNSDILIDGAAPSVGSVSVPANGTYVAGQNLDFTVNFDEAVTVDTGGGVPRLAVTLDTGGTVYADYLSGSGSGALVFRLTVASGQLDSNGVSLGSSIQLNGSTLKDAVGNEANTILNGVASTAGVHVDAVRPTATISVADTALAVGQTSLVTITFSEAVSGFTSADLSVANGTLDGLSSSDGGITWTAILTPAADIEDSSNLITLNNTGVQDLAGNTGSGTTDSNNYAIDTLRPTATIVVANPILAAGDSSLVTITFNEAVTGLTTADLSIANGVLSGLSSSDGGITWTATLTPNANVADTSNLITLANTGVQDAAGNTGLGTTDSNNYAIDSQAPAVSSVSVPANGTYVAGQNLDFTVNFDEAVTVDASGGTPRLAVTLDTGGTVYADYLSGSGSGALVFRLTIASGQLDSNGVSLGSSIQLNGSTLKDAVGNDANTVLDGVASTAGVHVDAQAPSIASVGVPVGVPYNAGDVLSYTVNTSENVVVDTTGGTPRLAIDIGGVTRYATYVAGSGTSTLVFQYSVQTGDNDADGITLAGTLDLNGSAIRDAAGNALLPTLNNPGDASGVIVDTDAPAANAIVTLDANPTSAGSVRYTVTFDEAVTGVDTSDFSLVPTGSASGSITTVTQLDGRTYSVLVSGLSGEGTLRLDLNASGTGIVDSAGNAIAGGLSGQSYQLVAAPLDHGDPEFRVNPPTSLVEAPNAPLQPALPSAPLPPTTSPLLPPPLFEVPTLGSGIPTLGNIFINQNALAPSYIAQVFSSSGDVGGDGAGVAIPGFGGGVFGSSSLSSVFGRDTPQDAAPLEVFDGKKWGSGGAAGFGAPTLGQQLRDIREGEQRPLRELAHALQQISAAQAQT